MTCFLVFFLLMCYYGFGQNPSQDSAKHVVSKRIKYFSATSVTAYGIAILGMNQLWYKNYPRSKFHFYDDNKQWKQLDKIGHGYTAFYISELHFKALSRMGLSSRKATYWSGITGFLWMLPIEILDGFSAGYGASSGDLLANLSGSLLFVGQKLWLNQIYIRPKFGFYRSGLAPKRPKTLGSNLAEEILKDYNSQYYRLSFDMNKIINRKILPSYINIAFGYGAGNMLYGRDLENKLSGIRPYRRYMIGLDWNFSNIKTRSRILKSFFYFLDMLSFPAPTLVFRSDGKIKFSF